jgi:23S rRNA (uracil1939-C5)-methyltransferase
LLLTIEKLIYGGDGLSHLPADSAGRGKAAFVPFVLPGEEIEASITEQRSGFARAVAERIVKSSPHRIEPKCPYFGPCGGCHYQHIDYEQQLQIKKEILRETLKRTSKLELEVEIQVHSSPPWNYRNRTRLQVQTSPTFQAGYFRMQSHELLAVEECPISSPLINRGIAQLWQSGRANKVPQGVREIEFFANADDSKLLIELTCRAEARRAAVRGWAEEICSAMHEIAGATALREGPRGALPEKFITVGANYLTYQTQRADYRVSNGSFFQVNRYLTEELVHIVTAGQTGERALDLYAGVGLFSTALAGDMRHIVSVESSQTSTSDLAYNLPSNGVAVQATTEQYLSGAEGKRRVGKGAVLPHGTHNRPDLAVVDPPRNGLGERVARMVATLGAPRVVYVSCDPATLARDLVVLLGAGYRIREVHMVDLFPQTYHLETVVHLVH